MKFIKHKVATAVEIETAPMPFVRHGYTMDEYIVGSVSAIAL